MHDLTKINMKNPLKAYLLCYVIVIPKIKLMDVSFTLVKIHKNCTTWCTMTYIKIHGKHKRKNTKTKSRA